MTKTQLEENIKSQKAQILGFENKVEDLECKLEATKTELKQAIDIGNEALKKNQEYKKTSERLLKIIKRLSDSLAMTYIDIE